MPHSRFFLDASFVAGSTALLEEEEAHHLMRVMRKKTGETIELVNGRHQCATAEILELRKNSVLLRQLSVESASPPSYSIILCQALPRLGHLDLIVEKGVELGMTALWLFPGERSEKHTLSPTQLRRLHLIAIAAMKQSGRLDLPPIILKPALKEWSSVPFPAFFGDLDKAPPFLQVFERKEGVLFFVGPEAGLTPSEILFLNKLQAQGASLGPHILRAETAAITALALIANK